MSNPFDLNNLGGLMSGLQQKMQQMKAEVAATVVTGEAGGLVKVSMNGEFEVQSIEIAEGAMDDREMLEDLLVAAQNDAVRRSKELMASKLQEITGGLPIPPGMLGF